MSVSLSIYLIKAITYGIYGFTLFLWIYSIVIGLRIHSAWGITNLIFPPFSQLLMFVLQWEKSKFLAQCSAVFFGLLLFLIFLTDPFN
ncbi:hypothetical protein HOF92_08695 [bacterium]|jgi:hypothetical protein|nr:hypothetical protein [bacterium]